MNIVRSAEEAVSFIRSGMNIFVHGSAATPAPLLSALAARADLRDVSVFHLHTEGSAAFLSREVAGRITSYSFFTGPDAREAIQDGRADFIPVFLSDVPDVITSGRIRIDAALVQLSPPDKHGSCTLGTSIDAARAAVDTAPIVIAEINDRFPRTHGNTAVPLSRVTCAFRSSRELPDHPPGEPTEVEARIGRIVADLIEDGSTLQMGIGAIPDAVLSSLGNKHDLGVHTEMFSDRLIDLVEAGVITNRRKEVHPGRIVTSFCSGSRRLYDFVDDNCIVEFHGCDRTNDTAIIRRNPKVVAINSALQIDLTGQVCADSIGHRIYSGIGGQMDFIRGAALSPGGKAIIAIPSTASGGKLSRITPELLPGAGVVTTRGHVHWIVTEYGAVNLWGLSLRQRGEALISISHPDFRKELMSKLAELRHFALK